MVDKFGYGAFSSGSKFSGFAGDSSDITIGTKSTINVSSVVNTNFGITSNFQLGPTFTYFSGYPKSFPGAELLNKYICEYKYYGAKQVIFNTADQGSTECTTKKSILTQDSFSISTGFDGIKQSGSDAFDSYEKYIESIESTAKLFALANVLANITSLSVALGVEDGYKDNIIQTAVQISSNLISVGLAFTAMVQAVNKKTEFVENLTPRSVICGDAYNGLFFGSRALHAKQKSKKGYVGKTSAITMRDTIKFEVSKSDEAFEAYGSMKYGRIAHKPSSLMNLSANGMYAVFPRNIELNVPKNTSTVSEKNASNGASFKISRSANDDTYIKAESDKLFFISTQKGTNEKRSLLGLNNSQVVLKYQNDNLGSMLVLDNNSANIGFVKDGKLSTSKATFREEEVYVSSNKENYIKIEKKSTSIYGGGASINLEDGSVIIGGELKIIADRATGRQSPVVSREDLDRELESIRNQSIQFSNQIVPPPPFDPDEDVNPPMYDDNHVLQENNVVDVEPPKYDDNQAAQLIENQEPELPPYFSPIPRVKLPSHYVIEMNKLIREGLPVDYVKQMIFQRYFTEIARQSHLVRGGAPVENSR
jgi:hypothetical protein